MAAPLHSASDHRHAHAGGDDGRQSQAHGRAHGHAAASMLTVSAAARLAVAGGLAAALWLLVLWAMG